MIWPTTVTSTDQKNMTSTKNTAIYELLRSRMSFAGFWLLKMGSETIPAWQNDGKQSQFRHEPFTA